MTFKKIIVRGCLALYLTLHCGLYEASQHIELSPMDLVGFTGAEVRISLMSTDKV